MSDELIEINKMLEEYILYLKTGAFRRLSIEDDIRLCKNAIKDIDGVFSKIHSHRMKKYYVEYAKKYREILLSTVDENENVKVNAISICEKVIENPKYENCKELEYIISKVYYGNEYNGVTAENYEQERQHKKLYYNAKNKIIFLNNCL